MVARRRFETLQEPLLPQPQGRPPLPRVFRFGAVAGHPRPRSPPAPGQTDVRLARAHGTLAETAARLGLALRADQRPGEPRPPVPRRQPARLPRLLVPPQRQPRDGGHPAGGVSEIPRRRRQLLRIHRTETKKNPAFRPGFFAMQGAVISSPPALCPSFRQAVRAP